MPTIMTIEEIRGLLEDRKIPVVSQRTMVSPATLYAIRDGTNASPRYDTMRKLSLYFSQNAQ